jgi:copper chaperone
MTALIELTLPDMNCGHCVATITRVLTEQDPEARIEPDLTTKRVRFTTQLSEASLRSLLDDEGFTPAP